MDGRKIIEGEIADRLTDIHSRVMQLYIMRFGLMVVVYTKLFRLSQKVVEKKEKHFP